MSRSNVEVRIVSGEKKIETVAATVRYDVSRELSVLAAQLGVTKNQLCRGVLYYALRDKKALVRWLNHNPSWMGYE